MKNLLKRYCEDYCKQFRLCLKYLNMGNVRFFETEKTWLQRNQWFFCIIPMLMFQFVTMWIYIYKLLSQVQIYEMAYLLPPFLVILQGFIKVAVILPNRNNITKIIDGLGEVWRVDNLSKLQEKEKEAILKKLHMFNSVSFWINGSGTLQYLTTPLIETVIRRLILGQDRDLLLPLASAYPFDPNYNWIVYIMVYIFQFCTMFISVFYYCGSELILTTLCALIGCQLNMLRDDFLQVRPSCKRMESDEMTIYDFIKRHQRLITLSRQLDEVFNPMIFANLLFVGITTCFFRYAAQFSRGPIYMLSNYVAVFASLLQVLHLCYYGELLTGASLSIGDAAFQNPWHKGDAAYQKAIWFIIKRSQVPCCLTSMRYARISLHMFTTVISTTWSYISLMNSVYGD